MIHVLCFRNYLHFIWFVCFWGYCNWYCWSLQFINQWMHIQFHINTFKTFQNTLKHCDMFRSFQIIIREPCSLLKLYYSIHNSIRICKRGVVATYHVGWECVVEQWLGVRRMLSNKRLVFLNFLDQIEIFYIANKFRFSLWFFFSYGAAAQRGSRLPYSWGF